MNLPDLNLLVALDMLLEEGSAVGAARRMNISTPAMSRTLTRIREAFGDPVLVRSGRGLMPTPRALELREQIRGLVEQAHAVFTVGREIDLTQLERTFNLRANDVFVGAFGGKLRELLDRHAPRSVLRFVPEGDLDDSAMEEGRIDLYISATRNFRPDTKVQNLFSTRLVGLAREDHPIFDAAIDAQRLTAFDHISVSRRGRASGPLDDELELLGLRRKVSLITPNFYSAIFALPGSNLILPIMPHNMMEAVTRLGLKLRAFPLPVPLETINIVQAWHPRLDNDYAHRWLRRLLKQSCSAADSSPNDGAGVPGAAI